jgi:hypothetical protein
MDSPCSRVCIKTNNVGRSPTHTRQIIFIYFSLNIFHKQRGRHRATLQKYKATWTSLLTNEKAKSSFTRRLLRPSHPLMWALYFRMQSKVLKVNGLRGVLVKLSLG